MSKPKINSYSEFQPLEEIVLGSTFAPDFFEDVKNSQIRDGLQKIAAETEEDLQGLKTTLEGMGVVCHKPTANELGFKPSIMDYVNKQGNAGFTETKYEDDSKFVFDENVVGEKDTRDRSYYEKGRNLIPVPPLNPRDDIITMGEEVLFTSKVWNFKPWMVWFEKMYGKEQLNMSIYDEDTQFCDTDFIMANRMIRYGYLDPSLDDTLEIRELGPAARKWIEENPEIYESEHFQRQCAANWSAGFCAPQLTRIGKDCIVDISERADIDQWMAKTYPQFNYITSDVGGHNDSVFAMLKPGVVLTSQHVSYHDEIVPNNWTEIHAHTTVANILPAREWTRIKKQNGGKWWAPGEEENQQFKDFVDSWLEDWVGEIEETVFDVNVLMVNEKTCICNAYNEELFKQFKAVGIEPIVVKNRHRFFWDAGWHCVTVDVRRKGGQEDYGFLSDLKKYNTK